MRERNGRQAALKETMGEIELNGIVRETNGARSARATETAEPPSAVDYGPLESWVGFYLRLAQNASFQAFAREARGIDVSPGRFATLMLIGLNPGISQTVLSRANARDKSSLTPVLEDLERRKFIRRVRPKSDRRSYRLLLTPAGERLLKQLTACATSHDRNLDRIIGPRERERFLKTLKKLVAELSPANGKENGSAKLTGARNG
jgi:DNA-binding MarR family transcriptional regulator